MLRWNLSVENDLVRPNAQQPRALDAAMSVSLRFGRHWRGASEAERCQFLPYILDSFQSR